MAAITSTFDASATAKSEFETLVFSRTGIAVGLGLTPVIVSATLPAGYAENEQLGTYLTLLAHYEVVDLINGNTVIEGRLNLAKLTGQTALMIAAPLSLGTIN